MKHRRLMLLIMFVVTLQACGESQEDLRALAEEAISEQFELSETPLIEIKEIRSVVPTTIPPREFLSERSDLWEYLAVNAHVVLNEPTYQVVNHRLISPLENQYQLVLKEVTPAGYEGVLVGKIRRTGSYVSGFYPHSIFGEKSLQVGKFLSSFNQSGKHEIQILDSMMLGSKTRQTKADSLNKLQDELEAEHSNDVTVDRI